MKATKVLILGREQTVVDHMATLLHDAGLDVEGTTTDASATSQLESHAIDALVIGGGVQDRSRLRLQSLARKQGIPFVQGALRGKEPETYVRDELVPQIQQATAHLAKA
jgi:DNA-binding NtrC family response regulator